MEIDKHVLVGARKVTPDFVLLLGMEARVDLQMIILKSSPI
jgi:hypothetical protein